ncbi:DUF3558 domain-containing protein [Saccharopolyspora shandongensis]|nr:DUF3558 domain-containing protein [Saccharopolyspora shandongensis]
MIKILRTASEEIVRKRLAVGAVLASMLLAGCSGGPTEPPRTTSTGSAPSEPTVTQSNRSAQAKSLDVADQCSIVTEPQAKSLGADQPPETSDSNGKAGCDYLQGKSGGGFIVFVSADKSQTMQKFADARKSSVQMIDISGYPTAQVGNKTNCLLALDVSDQGSLYVNTVAPSGNPNPCDLSKQFAEAALKNLPNA